MNILLVIPNTRNAIKFIPLGVLYVAAALREAGFCNVKIIDARIQNLSDKRLTQQVKEFSPQLVGITGTSLEASTVHKLAALVKEVDDHCKVAVGGCYATISPAWIMQDSNVDFSVIGEGEETVCDLVRALAEDNDYSSIDGLVYRDNARLVMSKPRVLIEDIDSIPFPAWDLIDMERYFNMSTRHSLNSIPASSRIAPLFTSRGCPSHCIFCHKMFGKRVRLRSVQNVIKEIEILVKRYRVAEIEIIDDMFNFDLSRAKQICDEIAKRDFTIKLSFPNGLRVDRMDVELIAKLKDAGAHLIWYGIESASPIIQRRIRKDIDLQKAKEIIRETAKKGIITGGFFMLGFPQETKQEMLQTIKFAKETILHTADFFYVTVYPGTDLYDMFPLNGINPRKATSTSVFKLSTNVSAISDAELKKVWVRAYREFYFRPAQMLRIWRALPMKAVLFKNLSMVLHRFIFARG